MMEKYTNHLEELVADRTEQLEEEKAKTDELLYRMLPRYCMNIKLCFLMKKESKFFFQGENLICFPPIESKMNSFSYEPKSSKFISKWLKVYSLRKQTHDRQPWNETVVLRLN